MRGHPGLRLAVVVHLDALHHTACAREVHGDLGSDVGDVAPGCVLRSDGLQPCLVGVGGAARKHVGGGAAGRPCGAGGSWSDGPQTRLEPADVDGAGSVRWRLRNVSRFPSGTMEGTSATATRQAGAAVGQFPLRAVCRWKGGCVPVGKACVGGLLQTDPQERAKTTTASSGCRPRPTAPDSQRFSLLRETVCVWAVYYKQIRKSEQRPPLHLRAADLVPESVLFIERYRRGHLEQ